MSPVRSRRYCFALACCAAALFVAASAYAQEPEKVTACDLKNHSGDYNHKLIEVTGFVSHGFENFTLYDPGCSAWPEVWLEYGGTVNSGTVYCCATEAHTRTAEPVIENVPIPLVNDSAFREFDAMIQGAPDTMVHATIVGTYFAGNGGKGGFGHLGCCTLLMIQQIAQVDPHDRADLDYRTSTDPPKFPEKVGCGVGDMRYGHSDTELIDDQRSAEAGERAWAFDDPQRVGLESLAGFLRIDDATIKHMKQTQEGPGRFIYEWKSPGDNPSWYKLVVSRPYWLSFYSKDSKRVAWVVEVAYHASCGMLKEKKQR
jgi:hypothetical protein